MPYRPGPTRRFFLLLAASSLAFCSDKVLFDRKSKYNRVIVTEDTDGLRTLLFEKNGARQSVVKPGDPDHLELPYARSAMLGLAFTGRPKRALVVGLGGGSIPSFLHKHFPDATIESVDIDPMVVDVARRYFGLREDANQILHTGDGRLFIERNQRPFDLVFLDAFSADAIPYRLATVEFLRGVRRSLSPGGAVVANVWSRWSNPLYDRMVRTFQEVFNELYIFDVPGASNKILVALPRKAGITAQAAAAAGAGISKRQKFRFDLGELAAYGFHAAVDRDPQARVLTDAGKPE